MSVVDYSLVRNQMQVGDALACRGKGRLSRLILWAIGGNVSHVGSVLHRVGGTHTRVEVIESTSLNGKARVQVNAASWLVENYNGSIWWMRLHPTVRSRFNELEYLEEATKILNRPYDFGQAVLSALPNWMIRVMGWFGYRENLTEFFCSEAVAHLYEVAGILPAECNASAVNPRELVAMPLFMDPVQIRGEPGSPF